MAKPEKEKLHISDAAIRAQQAADARKRGNKSEAKMLRRAAMQSMNRANRMRKKRLHGE